MSCIADVNKAILDRIFKEYIDGRVSFKRTGLDTFVMTQQIKNKSKDKATAQAEEALKTTLKRIVQEHSGYLKAEITRPYSIYDGPIGAKLIISPAYLKHVLQTQVDAQDRDGRDIEPLLSPSRDRELSVNADDYVEGVEETEEEEDDGMVAVPAPVAAPTPTPIPIITTKAIVDTLINTRKLSDLNNEIERFLKNFGFTTKQLHSLLETTGYDIIGATDLLEKTIFVQKENIDQAYTKEAAYAVFSLLGRKNILRKEIIASIHLIDNYAEKRAMYANSKLNDYQIRQLVAIDYLKDKFAEAHKEALETTNTAVSIDASAKNKLEYTVLKIKQWWSNVVRKFLSSYKKSRMEDTINQIANDVINNNTRLFNLPNNKGEYATKYKRMELEGKHKEIDDILTSPAFGAINSGSLALNWQGTLTRHEIKDLDYFVPYDRKDMFILSVKNKFPTVKFAEPFSGVFGDRVLTLSMDIDGIKVDLFLPSSQEVSDANRIVVGSKLIKYHYWKDIFDAKIRIGNKKHLTDLAGFVPFLRKWIFMVNDPGYVYPVAREERARSTDVVGQRHFNFDFMQSKRSTAYDGEEDVIQTGNIRDFWDKNLHTTATNFFFDNNIDYTKSKQYNDLVSHFNDGKRALVAYYLTYSENFKKFFGNQRLYRSAEPFTIGTVTGKYSKPSILTDEMGEPKIFYHGAGTTFDKFSKDYFLSGEGAMAYGAGFYTTSHKPTADNYRDTAKSAMVTFKEMVTSQDARLKELIDKMKIDINEESIIDMLGGSLGMLDPQERKNMSSLLAMLGITETKSLYISMTNPLYWDGLVSLENKMAIEKEFKTSVSPQDKGGNVYTRLKYLTNLNDKEVSARLYQIGIDGILRNTHGGMTAGGFRQERGEVHAIFFEPVQAKAVENSGLFSLENENMYDPIMVEPKAEIAEEQEEEDSYDIETEEDDMFKEGTGPLLMRQRLEPLLSPSGEEANEERDKVNANKGDKNPEGMEQEKEYADPTVGYHAKAIEFKQKLVDAYELRHKVVLQNIEEELAKKDKNEAKLAQLASDRRWLQRELHGFKDEVGLKQELIDLKKESSRKAMGYYVERDIERLLIIIDRGGLAQLNGEAKNIIRFYEAAGDFTYDGETWENPLFSLQDVYVTDSEGNLTTEFKLSKEERDTYQNWANQVVNYRILVNKKVSEAAQGIVSEDAGIQRAYPEGVTIKELTDASKLRDIHWFDMWTMDPTKNIFRQDSKLVQVIFNKLQDAINEKSAIATNLSNRVDAISDKTQAALKRLNLTLKADGIQGLDQGSYSILLERNEDGKLNGGYVKKFNQRYEEAKDKVDKKFSEEIGEAHSRIGPKKYAGIKKAFVKKRNWYRKNVIILRFNQMPEIIEDEEFKDFKNHFDSIEIANQYKADMLAVLDQKEYDRQVVLQKKMLRKYATDRSDMAIELMNEENVEDENDLSAKNKEALLQWIIMNSPYYGLLDTYEINFRSGQLNPNFKLAGNYQKYNVFVPRKKKPKLSKKADGKSINIDSTNEDMDVNYYNENYEKYIEKDEDLYSFYLLLEEAMQQITRDAPPDLQNKLATNFLASIEKTTAEVLTSNYSEHKILQRIIPAFKLMWEKFRGSFGVKQQNDLNFVSRDEVTGRVTGEPDASFLRDNSNAIRNTRKVETYRFLRTINTNPRGTKNFDSLSGIHLDHMNTESLILLNDLLGMRIPLEDLQRRRLSKLSDRVGNGEVDMYRIIKDYSTHEVVKDNSYDLARMIKHVSKLSALYSAKAESIPALETLKKYHDNIGNEELTNTEDPIFNIPDGQNDIAGPRKRSMARLQDYWERVILGNTSREHKGVFGKVVTVNPYQDKINELSVRINDPRASETERAALREERERLIIKGKIPFLGRTIYSEAEKKTFADIEVLLGENTGATRESVKGMFTRMKEITAELNNPLLTPKETEDLKKEKAKLSEVYELSKIQVGLGKVRTRTAIFDNILNWLRHQRLGWNVKSGVTNLFEGYFSNTLIAADGRHFSPNNIFRAYGLLWHSFIKNITFGYFETGTARKIRILVDRFDTLVDPSNELQGSSTKTFTSKLEWLQAMTIVRRGEFINQGALLLATLLDQQVTNRKTGEVRNVFDAMDDKGELMDGFDNEEDVDTWENTKGRKWLDYKSNLGDAILLAHGNYSTLRGMMLKSSTEGRAIAMFKSWLPQQLYWRFASEQTDLQSRSVSFRGKYLSYTPTTAAIHGAVVGAGFAGPVGALVGAGIGTTAGWLLNRQYDRDTTNILQEVITSTVMLVKKMIAMPLNITGRVLVDTNKGIKIGNRVYDFDAMVGKGGFTQQDANSLKANMQDIAMQLTLLAFILFIKTMFWDDDDDKESGKRKAHNILVNRLMQLSSQAGGYVNIGSKESFAQTTLGSVPILSYLTDLGKVVIDANKALHGEDTIKTGFDVGESRLYNSFKQVTLPGLLNSPLDLGMENESERQFNPHPFDTYFKLDVSGHRKEIREELEESGHPNSYITKELNKRYPTKGRLKKLGVTRKEYLDNAEEMSRKKTNKIKVEEKIK